MPTFEKPSVADLRHAADQLGMNPSMMYLNAVQDIVAYAFWARHERQPRRKRAVDALAAIDPQAADLVRRWQTVDDVAALARHVLGVDTFFAWTSAKD